MILGDSFVYFFGEFMIQMIGQLSDKTYDTMVIEENVDPCIISMTVTYGECQVRGLQYQEVYDGLVVELCP